MQRSKSARDFLEYRNRRKNRFDERIHDNRGVRNSKTRNHNNRYTIDNVNLAVPINKIYNSKLLNTNKIQRYAILTKYDCMTHLNFSNHKCIRTINNEDVKFSGTTLIVVIMKVIQFYM